MYQAPRISFIPMLSPSQSNRDKKVRFGLEDEVCHYPAGDYSESPSESGVEEEEAETDDNGKFPPPLLSSSPSSIRSTSSSDGPFTPSSSPPSILYDMKSNSDRLCFNATLTNPGMAWDTFDLPTKDVMPQLASCGRERAILSHPRRLASLTLVHTLLRRWPMRIDLRHVEALTVEDFYFMIHQHLYEPLPQLDVVRYAKEEQMPQSHSKRCKEQQLNKAEEPLRRIDLMQLHRLFCGIRELDRDAGCWELILLPITQ